MKAILFSSILTFTIISCQTSDNINSNALWRNGFTKTQTIKTKEPGEFYILELDSLGKITKLTAYKDSLKDGSQIYFRPNKEIGALINFKKDKREGNVFEFYPKLIPAFKGFTSNGKFNGQSSWYYENGQLRETGKRDEDKDVGLWKYFKENGEIDTTITK